jgi:mono/diheme cytochrome c family protein
MPRAWLPVLVGVAIAAATFALAQLQVFAPSAPAGDVAGGDAYRGQIAFERTCARCHGTGGEGGGVGPRLVGTGLDASTVAAAVQQGRGVMPAGLVTGRERADVVAYVVSISGPGG